MAIQTGRDLLTKSNVTAPELRKSIAALKVESEYVRKCVNAGLRDSASGLTVMQEISELIKQLEEKLECIN
jgi:hypothetical protein